MNRPEKNAPGPDVYKPEKSFRYTINKVHGGHKDQDDRTTFFDHTTSMSNLIPGAGKYNLKDNFNPKKADGTMVKDLKGFKMADKVPRFTSTTIKNDNPAPTSYKLAEAYASANGFVGKMKILTDKRTSFVDKEAKKSISPGPAKHHYSIEKLSLLSPSTSRKRL